MTKVVINCRVSWTPILSDRNSEGMGNDEHTGSNEPVSINNLHARCSSPLKRMGTGMTFSEIGAGREELPKNRDRSD